MNEKINYFSTKIQILLQLYLLQKNVLSLVYSWQTYVVQIFVMFFVLNL